MPYVEFPADPVVNVHWKKKGEPEPPVEPAIHDTCGAWVKSLFYEETQNQGVPGFKYWIPAPGRMPIRQPGTNNYLYNGSLYAQGLDQSPGHDPSKPAGYWQVCKKHYLWSAPGGGWTVTYNGLPTTTNFMIGVWRGYSLHTLVLNDRHNDFIQPTYLSASAPGEVSMNIKLSEPGIDDNKPTIFALLYEDAVVGRGLSIVNYAIPAIVQAHCKQAEETTGAPPTTPGYIGDVPPTPPFDNYFLNAPYPVP